MSTPRSILIGLLICGNMTGSVVDAHGNYQEIYTSYLRSTIPHNCVAKIDIKSFKIGNLEFPDERRLDDYDIFVITGSANSAYEDAIPWIKKLQVFLKDLLENHKKVKICGICFGHQILGRVFGGECVSSGQWEIGPTLVNLTDVGKSIFGADQLTLQQMHRDHVPVETLSRQFVSGELELIGFSSNTDNEGFIEFYPASRDVLKTPRNIHVLTLQGHPEFSEALITKIVRQRSEIMGLQTVTNYWGHKGNDNEEEPQDKEGTGRRWLKTDGVDIVSKAIWNMLDLGSS
ncbi:hypothetical protein Ac2012v2_002909 [Leucoagaricus gongylophorus]